MKLSKKNIYDLVRDGGRQIRRTTQELYLVTMRMRAIQAINRAAFLQGDASLGEKLKLAIENNALAALPLGALNGASELKFVFVQLTYTDDEMAKITSFAYQYGLVAMDEAE